MNRVATSVATRCRRPAPFALLALALSFAAAGCSDAPAGQEARLSEAATPMSAQTQSALAVLPAGARFLAAADAQALRAGGVFSGHGPAGRGPGAPAGEMSARLEDFLDATGFDPATDVQTVYAAKPGGEAPPQLVVAADFDRARFQEQLEGEMGDLFEQATYRGQPLYQRTGDGGRSDGRGHAFAFALAPGGLVLLAPRPEDVRQMIDRLEDGNASAGTDDEALRLAEQVRGRGDAWFVTRDLGGALRPSPGDTARHAAPARFRRVAEVVRNAAGALTVGDDGVASGELLLYTQDGAAPDDLEEVLEGLVSALSSRDALPADQQRALESVEIDQAGEAVRVRFSVPMSN